MNKKPSNFFNTKIFRSILVLVAMFALAGGALAQGWTGNSATPPGNNTPPPINTAPNSQSKQGGVGLGILSFFAGWFEKQGINTAGYNADGTLTVKAILSGNNALHIFGHGVSPATRNVKIWDNLDVVGTTTTNNLVVKNYARLPINTEICTAAGSCTTINTGGVSKWTQGTGDNIYRSTGKVGIGTVSPAYSLDVYGTGHFSNALLLGAKGALHGFLNSEDSAYFNLDADNTGVNGQAFVFGRGRTGASGGTELVRITDAGNVGIGTTNPTSKLHVNGTANLEGGNFVWNNGTGDYTASFKSADSRDILFIDANNAKVGIHNAAPTADLHVNGTVRFQNLPANTVNDRVITSDSNGNLGYKAISEIAGGGGSLPVGTNSQTLRYNGGTANAWVASDNLLNNGTTVSIGGNLSVAGTAISGIRYHKISRDARMTVSTPTKDWSIANGWASAPADSFAILEEGVNGHLVIAPGGNVGLGVLNPQSRLDVSGRIKASGGLEVSSGLQGITFKTLSENPSNTQVITRDSSTGDLGWKLISDITTSEWTTNGVNIYNANTGNVGVGTINPTAKLHTNGSVRLESLSNQTAYPQVVVRDTAGNLGWKLISDITTSGLPTGSLGQTLHSNGTSWIADNVIDNNGNRVVVSKDTTLVNNAYIGGYLGVVGMTKVLGNLGLSSISTENPNFKLSFGTSLATTGNKLALYENNGASVYGFGITSGSLDFYAGGGKRMALNQNGTLSLPNLPQAVANTGYTQTIVRKSSGELAWQNLAPTVSIFTKDAGVKSSFTLTGGDNNATYQVEENFLARDYLVMVCNAGYQAISGGGECGWGSNTNLKTSIRGDAQAEWRISCGDELKDIAKASITCQRFP